MRTLFASLAIVAGSLWLPATSFAAVDGAASEACVECHDAEDMPDWKRNAHNIASDPRVPGCVTCHGPSKDHVKKPPGASKQPPPDRVFSRKGGTLPADRNAACLQCHDKDAKRALWHGSAHDTAEVACTSCHQIHSNQDKVAGKFTQADVCYACHKEQRVQMQRPSHHPVPEGKMNCSDCHNVHGSVGPKLAKRDSTNATCYTCHAEKRGPFVHPHEPVTDDCANCHNPHGTTVAALLKSRPPMLCNQCHTPHATGAVGAVGGQRGVYPPAAPGQSSSAMTATTNGKNVVNMWQGRSCMNCHTQVHGSNNPAATNPTPNLLFR